MPKTYLYKFYLTNNISTSFHMAMAHLILEDDRYLEWSKEQKNLGRYIILDNSAPYFGRALDNESLFKCINMINPDEIVLPDVIGDFKETVNRSLSFLKELEKVDLRIMAVPQGNSLEEYIECYKIFSSDDKINVLGIPYTINNIFSEIPKGNVSGREYLLKLLNQKGMLNPKKIHHLLGFGDSGHIELKKLSRFSFIRSCDSNLAYLTAKTDIEFNERVNYKKPKLVMDFKEGFNELFYKSIIKNAKTLSKLGGHNV